MNIIDRLFYLSGFSLKPQKYTGLEIDWIEIPSGEYILPSLPNFARGKELGPYGWWYTDSHDCAPSRRRKITTGNYKISRMPITNEQYQIFLLSNPSWKSAKGSKKFVGLDYPKHWKGNRFPKGQNNHPIVNVSKIAAEAFCSWASQTLGFKVCLPAFREWEIADIVQGDKISKWLQNPFKNEIVFSNSNNTFDRQVETTIDSLEWTSGGSAFTTSWDQSADSDYNVEPPTKYRTYGWRWDGRNLKIIQLLGWSEPKNVSNNLGFRIVTTSKQVVELL
jgi:hypothetical protein